MALPSCMSIIHHGTAILPLLNLSIHLAESPIATQLKAAQLDCQLLHMLASASVSCLSSCIFFAFASILL